MPILGILPKGLRVAPTGVTVTDGHAALCTAATTEAGVATATTVRPIEGGSTAGTEPIGTGNTTGSDPKVAGLYQSSPRRGLSPPRPFSIFIIFEQEYWGK